MSPTLTDCSACGRTMAHTRQPPPGTVRHEARGMCTACYTRHGRDRTRAACGDIETRIPATTIDDGDWKAYTACGPDTARLFDPPASRNHTEHVRIERARAICARCPVTSPCLEEALTDPIACGVHAGRLIAWGQVTREPAWVKGDGE